MKVIKTPESEIVVGRCITCGSDTQCNCIMEGLLRDAIRELTEIHILLLKKWNGDIE